MPDKDLPLPLLAARKTASLLAHIRNVYSRRASRYAGRPVLSAAATNEMISVSLRRGEPFMVSRIGTAELAVWKNFQGVIAHGANRRITRWASRIRGESADWSPAVTQPFANNAGFFSPTGACLRRYAEALGDCLGAADLMAIFRYDQHEERALARHAPHSTLGSPMGLEAYYHDQPWSLALAGRRVLVVHPFAGSISAQYAHRRALFGGKEVLPDFDLVTIPAVQTIAGENPGFPDWFAALDGMRARIAETQFDIAIIGAGAYGLPLAAYVKQLGKQAIHLGGSTQVLFGIRGRRWDDRPEVSRFYNDYWVRPSAAETPQRSETVEQGCYW